MALVALERVLALANPLRDWPWCTERPSEADLATWLATAPLVAAPVDTDEPAERHAGRIRYLALNGWTDAVQMDVGIPALQYGGPSWPLTDGNHRVAAAVLRRDAFIEVDVAGQVDHAARLLGVTEETIVGTRTA